MILTGDQIYQEVKNNRIIIEPFDVESLESNAYGFHLNDTVIEYLWDGYIDPLKKPKHVEYKISNEGTILLPGHFYLCSTRERMGSMFYAKTLHADFSVSSMGVWIQFSAPLGHVGAIINWTLEMQVAVPVRIYAGMKIGKLAFWKIYGAPVYYEGRYQNSTNTIPTRFSDDYQW